MAERARSWIAIRDAPHRNGSADGEVGESGARRGGSLLWLLEGLPQELLAEPVNLMRACLHPAGLITRVREPDRWAAYMRARLHREAIAARDPALIELEREITGYQPLARELPSADPGPFQPLRIAHHDADLAFISTIVTFGTPLDITTAELLIESFYPADSSTARIMSDRNARESDSTRR